MKSMCKKSIKISSDDILEFRIQLQKYYKLNYEIIPEEDIRKICKEINSTLDNMYILLENKKIEVLNGKSLKDGESICVDVVIEFFYMQRELVELHRKLTFKYLLK